MKIDWFTVIAQLLNFALLVWLLKRFLYKPILSAVDAREKKIQDDLLQAKNLQQEADAALKKAKKDRAEFEANRQDAWKKAEADIAGKKEAAMEKVRRDTDELREQLKKRLDKETAELASNIRDNIRTEVMQITGKTLKDLGSANLNEQIVAKFISQLDALNEEEQANFSKAAAASPLKIHTAFAISEEQQRAIVDAVQSKFELKHEPSFIENKSLIAGIELEASNYSLSWSVDQYLKGLDKRTAAIFKTKSLN